MTHDLPVIRLEIESMKAGILQTLSDYTARMDADIQAAVEAYCTPENITSIVQKAAADAIDEAIKSDVRHFFLYGDGRKFVKDAVNEQLGLTDI